MRNNANVPNNQGVIVGFNRIPVDQTIVSNLTRKNYEADYITKCVEANRHNDGTTAYYLSLKQHLK